MARDQRSTIQPITRELISGIILSDDAKTQAKFRQKFPELLNRLVDGCTACHKAVEDRLVSGVKSQRASQVRLFLHAAANSVTSAGHLLTCGYPVPAGNLLRHFAEATAMAMLLADKQSQVFEQLVEQKERYPVDESLSRVLKQKQRKRLQGLIGLDKEAWEAFIDMARFYGQHSHASAVAVLFYVKADWPHNTLIGGEYDAGKRELYRDDLRRAVSALRTLFALIHALDAVDLTDVPARQAAT